MMIKMYKKIAILGLFVVSPMAICETYYVTADGHQNNDGLTWGSAWTFQKVSTTVTAGDTVIVRKGDYPNYNSVLDISIAGTEQQPITIKGEFPYDPPSINRTSGGWAIIRAPYITIENIGCKGTPGICVAIRDTHHVTLQGINADGNFRGIEIRNSDDNVVEGSTLVRNREGIYVLAGSDRNLIKNNIVSYNGNPPYSNGDRCGVCIGEHNAGEENVIDGNTVAYNGGLNSDYGIIVYEAPRSIITNNNVHHNHRGGIIVTQYSLNSVVDGNHIKQNGFTACGNETNIAALSVRNGSSGTVLSNNIVKDNCVAAGNIWGQTDPRGGVDVRGWGDHRGTDDVSILFNQVSGTVNGPDINIDQASTINRIMIYPENQ